MIQKIYHIIGVIFGVVFITVLVFVSIVAIQISHVANNIQSTMEDLTREDVIKVLVKIDPAFYGEKGWIPSPRKIRFHFIDNEGWFVFWDSGNYTLLQRVEPWFESEFGGDWEILFDERK